MTLLDEMMERAGAFVERACAQGQVSGAVLGIADGAGLAQTRAWGTATTSRGVESARASHRFLLTSVTKVLTAAQVMALVEAGSLTLETPITEVIPEFEAGGKRDVTVAHVLTHTSGVGRRTSDTAERLTPALVRADHVQQAIRARASWPPGTRVEYSSALFWALGEVIDRLTGGSSVDGLGVWLRARAGADVGYATDKVPDDYVIPTSAEAAALAEQTRRIAFPAGGAIGSVEDVLRFGAQFLTRAAETEPRLLDHDSVGAMSRSWTTGLPGPREPDHAGPGTERAIGWALGGPGRFRPDATLWHAGVSGASVWVDRAAGIVVAFLSAQWFLPRAFYRDLADAVFAPIAARLAAEAP